MMGGAESPGELGMKVSRRQPPPARPRPLQSFLDSPAVLPFALGLFIGITVAAVPIVGAAAYVTSAVLAGFALARLLVRHLARRRARAAGAPGLTAQEARARGAAGPGGSGTNGGGSGRGGARPSRRRRGGRGR